MTNKSDILFQYCGSIEFVSELYYHAKAQTMLQIKNIQHMSDIVNHSINSIKIIGNT